MNNSVAHGKKLSAKAPNHMRCHFFPVGTLKRDMASFNFPLLSKRAKVTRTVKKEMEEDDDDGVVYMGSTPFTQINSTSSLRSGWQSASHAPVSSE